MTERMLAVRLWAATAVLAAAADNVKDLHSWKLGVPATRPVHLGLANFEQALEDPANPFWLLKFYAPWCGHCKRLTPVLDSVASELSGGEIAGETTNMAIGKIDCTTERKLCDQFQVRGYPTLKFSMDGAVRDYPGGRSVNDFLSFARKMTRPAVTVITSASDAFHHAQKQSETGVVFVAYDPAAAATGEQDDVTQSTLLAQIYKQVARKQRATAECLLLVPDDTTATLDAGLAPAVAKVLSPAQQAYVCRVEHPDIPVTCWDQLSAGESETLDSKLLADFITAHQLATVSKLGPNNFHAISRQGRPVVIGVVETASDKEAASQMQTTLTRIATTADKYRDAYYYGWMDGKQFYKFLDQFGVSTAELPQVFVLNQAEQLHWQNASYFSRRSLSLEDQTRQFLRHVQDGTIPSQIPKGASKGLRRVLDRLLFALVQYRPWSIVLVVLVIMAVAVAIAACVSPGDDEPPMPPQHYRVDESSTGSAAPSTAMPPAPSKEATTTSAETKKDK